jgi:L1 cell adhesion molecule like protein
MNSSDTLIGIDFGSHSVVVSCALSSAALPSWDSSSLGVDVEVLADELGLRSVPSVVAFRGSDEVILGHAAIQQRSKNAVNTFVDIRSFLCDGVVDKESGEVKHSVYVPALDKEISTIELAAHFFKHIVSQLKQRSSISSKIVYDCAVSLPSRFVQYDPHSTAAQGRIREAAKTAGLRIRGFCSDGIGCLLASGFDRPSAPIFLEKGTATVATIDVGWSSTQISIYSISSGFISPLVESRDSSFSISSMVLKLVEFCTKDFQRRYKLDCSESARAILRLRAECENCLKILSSSQETTIVLDSLFEGVDYSVKISRSRVEDLCGVLCMSFKTRVADALACAEVSPGLLDHLLIIGGGGAVPAVQHPIRTLCSNASTDILRKVRIDPSEAVAVGACMYCIQVIN